MAEDEDKDCFDYICEVFGIEYSPMYDIFNTYLKAYNINNINDLTNDDILLFVNDDGQDYEESDLGDIVVHYGIYIGDGKVRSRMGINGDIEDHCIEDVLEIYGANLLMKAHIR
jgi:hypothetical protein